MTIKAYKAKKWTRKICKKNNKTVEPVNCEEFLHPTDKAALAALKKIPFFDKLCAKFVEIFNEHKSNIINMSSHIHITEEQIPRIYHMVESICKKLGIDMPDLYLRLDRTPNAEVGGNKNVYMIINSGILECFEDDKIYAILAHECGHIACKHVLYHTMGRIILSGGERGLVALNIPIVGDLISTSLELAFFHWMRCSELSADRAAVVCCETASPVVESMMRLAGGTTHIDSEIRKDLFVAQSAEYKELTEESKVSKALEYVLTCGSTHPLLSVRAYQAQEWAQSEEYRKVISKD